MKSAPLVALAFAACASTGGGAANVPLDPRAEAPRSRALGSIVWYRDGQVVRRVSWDEARIASGAGTGPAGAVLLRTTDGRWTPPGWEDSTPFEVGPDRIERHGTRLTMTRVEGGFQLEGIQGWCQFDLLLTRERAVVEGRVFVRGPDGAYTCPALPGTRIVLEGDANRLDDPPWPQIALAAVAAGWGRGGWASPTFLNPPIW